MMQKIKILLVDDRPENLLTLESILEDDKRHFLSATSGAEALLMCNIESIGMILLDYQLDDMTGLEVAHRLRKNPQTSHIPIIFVTALSKTERKKLNEFEPGTVDFLFKPLELEDACTKVAIFEKLVRLQIALSELVTTGEED
ncbi:N/A [soil metagenome]